MSVTEAKAPLSAVATKLHDLLLAKVGGIERFASGWSWRSHTPKVRAEQAIADACTLLENGVSLLSESGATPEQIGAWRDKVIGLWLAYQAAGARTANPMVTGPANFPVDRNRKAMDVERRRGEEYYDFAEHPHRYLERLQRSADKAALSAEAASIEHRTLAFPGVKLVQNTTLDRIQLVFDGKPEADTIAALKGEAFRWSPRESAWQRKNTNTGVQAAYRVLLSLGHTKGQLTPAGIPDTTQDGRA